MIAACSIIFMPNLAQAKTRAGDTAAYATQYDGQNNGQYNGGADLRQQPIGNALLDEDDDAWLIYLFSGAALAAAIAFILSGSTNPEEEEVERELRGTAGVNQSNGAT